MQPAVEALRELRRELADGERRCRTLRMAIAVIERDAPVELEPTPLDRERARKALAKYGIGVKP